MAYRKSPRLLRISIDRKGIPGSNETPEQIGADAIFGVLPRPDFPGIIFETMIYEWSHISIEYDDLIKTSDGYQGCVKRYDSRDLDESGRADLIRHRRRA